MRRKISGKFAMYSTALRFCLLVLISLSVRAAEEQAPTKAPSAPPDRSATATPAQAKDLSVRPAQPPAPKKETAVTDTTLVDPVAPVAPTVPAAPETEAAKKERLRKEQLTAAETAKADEEKRRIDDASALARGEGERYAARLKAYEAARSGVGRTPVPPPKKFSLAQLVLPNGHSVVMAGDVRKEFATKAEADAYVAEIRRQIEERPLVISDSGK